MPKLTLAPCRWIAVFSSGLLAPGVLALASFTPTQAQAATPGKIALIQYNADHHFNQYAQNRAYLTRSADQAVAQHANIIVFPEGSSYGYADTQNTWCAPGNPHLGCLDVAQVAESVPNGPSTIYWESYARTHQVYVLFNIPEARGSQFFNTAVVVGPDGYVASYHKRALYAADELYATPGDRPLLLNTPYGKLGVLICMDVTYPGNLEEYKMAGADAAILMMDWDDDPHGSFAAITVISERAQAARLDVYASDSSAWDGSGKYPASPNGSRRERHGLPPFAIDQDGITYHSLKY